MERVIHSGADLGYADDLVCDEAELTAAHAALHAGAPVVADVEMVAAGITRATAVCRLKDAASGPGPDPPRTRCGWRTRRWGPVRCG